ncbi:MAG: acetyl/propionyl/methylcrotonyl-CoA carboxylase subunit alpha [Bacteroidia bacterium]
MRTCRKMGIKTVAVYSEADREALHVKFADEAYLLGPPPSAQSYLLGDKIIEICKIAGVDGIHPGYGFLSENSEFARKVKAAGIILIGPSPEAMEIMGNKLSAKAAVASYNVPMVPGINTAISDIPVAKQEAEKIGFPVLIKAAAGGGGKGMRVVNNLEDFEEQMNLAINEAKSAFGDGSVFLEKYVGSPRHIEIQILGDNFGNIVYLFERECSIQRRHQKLVEEAPSAIVSPELRKRMGEAAVNVAKACNYTGAGTVEFLVDEKLDFYFLEMNTRLQVEHPVTEMITGLDLVKEQIRVAKGEKLGYDQKDLKINGHAMELRVCAEDPAEDFVPSIGKLTTYKKPQGENIRVDDCMEQGMEIPIYYDNMIAKLIVWAPNRDEAITLMKKAINNYEIEGIKTTLPFGRFVMNHPAFNEGNFDTQFIKNYFTSENLFETNDEVAALFSAWYMDEAKKELVLPKMGSKKAWFLNRKE